ncbi:ABC transporter substrate-binding protein [Bradyrhizobium diazoefficiens]|uniref:ABC transporter substrate-binding protein n=1 Tax=Bradyrhizobium diazoefficiens TaxID=1355477 RepID=UPI00190A3303|nr:ABC transporter substrate-binding protein [Bradyrhizobium diazoefficiens]QQO35538.1 ABC transporter substrate-binding protein [Bradyrhizobium diazoefficiens]
MKNSISTASRRSFLAGVAGIIAAPIVLRASRAEANSDSVTIVSYGGSYQEAHIKTISNPFTQETGIKVEYLPSPGLDKIKAMQLTGNVQIDIWTSDGPSTASGSKQGFWEKLDLSMFDLKDLTIQPAGDYVANEVFPGGVVWDPKKYGPGKHPASFAEFFNLAKFPGRRAMRPNPNLTLEIALLADGVAPKDIYPLDLDRAFKSLDRIKSNTVWPAGLPQSISYVQTGEVDFAINYSNRVKGTTEMGGGVPLAFSFEQNLIGVDAVAIVKGAPRKKNAMRLIAYMLKPEVQARFYDLVGLVPVSKKAATMLSPEARKWQPDFNNPNNVIVSNEYWADNLESVGLRFKEWIKT